MTDTACYRCRCDCKDCDRRGSSRTPVDERAMRSVYVIAVLWWLLVGWVVSWTLVAVLGWMVGR